MLRHFVMFLGLTRLRGTELVHNPQQFIAGGKQDFYVQLLKFSIPLPEQHVVRMQYGFLACFTFDC
ncbi:hypothetical protein D3C78_1971240 [compost metagenome]